MTNRQAPRCVYCGGEMSDYHWRRDYYYWCKGCGARSPYKGTADEAYIAAMRPDRQIKGVCADCLWCTESDATNRIYCVYNGDGGEFETFPGEWCSGFARRITVEDIEKTWEESE